MSAQIFLEAAFEAALSWAVPLLSALEVVTCVLNRFQSSKTPEAL